MREKGVSIIVVVIVDFFRGRRSSLTRARTSVNAGLAEAEHKKVHAHITHMHLSLLGACRNELSARKVIPRRLKAACAPAKVDL